MLRQFKKEYYNFIKMSPASFGTLVSNILKFPFRYWFNLNTLPVMIIWDITYRCNLKCKYCMLSAKSHNYSSKEITIDEANLFLKKIAKYRPNFCITGGEPLLRDDLPEIIAIIRSYKMKAGIITNATLLTEEKLNALIKADVNYILLSFDINEWINDEMRGAGVYQKVVKALNLIKRVNSKVTVAINSVISEKSYDSLDVFLKSVESLGVDALKLSYICFSTSEEAKEHQSECLRRLGQNIQSDSYIMHNTPGMGKEIAEKVKSVKSMIKNMKIPVTFTPNLSSDEIVNWFNSSQKRNRKCVYTFNITRLAPNGDIYPCHFINYSVGNILSDNMIDVFNNRLYKQLRSERKKEQFPGCLRCNKL